MPVIKDLINVGAVEGDVGIEVEMEGMQLPKELRGSMWRVEHDASLGGHDNAEYVLRRPAKLSKVGEALTQLSRKFKDFESTLQPSVRAGVHVHLNVQQMELTEVANLVTLYLVVEDLLLEVCGEGRQSNLFCLKGCEAEYMLYRAAEFFKTKELGYIADDEIRYSGINLAAIPKYGSVEFRSLRTPTDLSEIDIWVKSLHHLSVVAKEYENPTEILKGYSDFDPKSFIKKVLPYYAEQLLEVSDWEVRLKRGMRSAQDLAFSQDWGVKVVVDGEDLPEEIQRMIADHPHIDPEAIIRMWRQRVQDNG